MKRLERFVVSVFFLAAWYAMINMKIDALMLAYSGWQLGTGGPLDLENSNK